MDVTHASWESVTVMASVVGVEELSVGSVGVFVLCLWTLVTVSTC